MATKITKEEVIERLRDDGDFDRLRLQIIRRLKENDDLRGNLISVVKQSKALYSTGAENMKPRQLSDAIFEEVGSKMMSQLSDGLWGIITSEDGMKNEIKETVQSVYNKLSHPGGEKEKDEVKGTPSSQDMIHVEKATVNNDSNRVVDGGWVPDKDPNEPGGLTPPTSQHNNSADRQHRESGQAADNGNGASEERKEDLHHHPDGIKTNDNPNVVKEPCDDSDEDPEVPPGFG